MELALVVADLAQAGGGETVAARTAVGLARRGHRVVVYTTGWQPAWWPEEPELAQLVRILPPPPPGRRLRQARAMARTLAPELARWPLVYAHGEQALYWSARCAPPLAWYCQEPARRLHAAHTEDWRRGADPAHPALAALQPPAGWRARLKRLAERRYDRACARRPRAVFVNSAYSAACFARVYRRPAEVLELGLPLPPPARGEPPAGAVGVIASERPHKNLHGILHAARAAPADLTWHVWGPGTDAQPFQELRRRLGLEPRVHLHGFVAPERAEALWRQIAVLVYLPLGEPFGLAGVEALLRGIPVLASDHGGPAEWLRRCGGGRSVDPLQPAAAAAALRAMLAELPRWRTAAHDARARAAEHYSWPRYLERTEQRLAQLRGAPPAGPDQPSASA